MNEIRDLREKTGMSRKEFAEFFEIPKTTLIGWEHGKRKPVSYIVRMMERILILEKIIEKKEV